MTTPAPRAGAFAALSWCPAWVALLLFTLMMPTEFSFSAGSLRLTPYRLVLILAFLPSLGRVLGGKSRPLHLVDLLVALHVLWSYVVIIHHHGLGTGVESGGIRMLEFGGAYLIARAYIVDERSFRGACIMLLTLLALLAPFVVVESITGRHLIKDIASALVGRRFHTNIEPRFGFARAFGPFDHPILLGVFAAGALGVSRLVALPQIGQPQRRRLPVAASAVSAVSSLSSGALATLMVQVGLLIWDAKTRYVQGRWKLLTAGIVAVYTAVDLLSNRAGYLVFLHYLTFSAHTAYNRVIIFQYGIQDVWRNPLYGIGFYEWTRPAWMHSASMDNFWLVQAVTFGIPGFLTIALAYLVMLSKGWGKLPPRLGRLRLGWSISLVGMMVAACTVHYWNNLFVYFAFFLGMGSWFLGVNRQPAAALKAETDYDFGSMDGSAWESGGRS